MISHQELKRLLTYDPLTGEFTRNVKVRQYEAGTVAGYVNKAVGYVYICIDNKDYLAHILAYFYMKGVWPTNVLDHANTIRHDNAWLNIRDASSSLNNANASVRSDNALGIKGVSKHGNKFKATCRGKYLGLFHDIEQAKAAYFKQAQLEFGEFARQS